MRNFLANRQAQREGTETSNSIHISRRLYVLGALITLVGIPFRQPLFIISGLLMLLAVTITAVWSHYCLQDLRYRRQLSEQRILFGETVTLSISVENAKLLPLPWLETEDTIARDLEFEGQELRHTLVSNQMVLECLFSPRWYERVTRQYVMRGAARGVHVLGPTRLRSGDIFGFTMRETVLSNHQYLLVYPLTVPITRFGLPARHPFGDRRAPRRLLEDPSQVIGVRNYVYGDSLRRVNWKATARTQKMQSKVYDATTTYTLVIFLNTTTRFDSHYGIHPELYELAVCSAASIADWAIDEGYAVGLHANSIMFRPDETIEADGQGVAIQDAMQAQLQRRRVHVPVSRHVQQREQIMEVLARVQPYFGTSIEDLIQTERPHLPNGATIVLITSNLSEVLVDTLAQLRQHGHTVAILFIGDSPVPVRLAGITVYHIGGEETWKNLVAAARPQTGHTPNADQSEKGLALS